MADEQRAEIRARLESLKGKAILVDNLNQPIKDINFDRIATDISDLLAEVERLRNRLDFVEDRHED